MVKLEVYGISLILCLLIYFCGMPLSDAQAMQRVWGTEMVVNQYIVIGESDEIPSGNWAYVFQKQGPEAKTVPKNEWEAMLSGDLSQIANQLKSQIPGCEPVWIKVSWEWVAYSGQTQKYTVHGLMVEAMVKNVNAGLTGAEIVLILIAAAVLVTIVSLCLTGSWVTWKVIDATQKISPWLTIIVGLIIVVGIGFLLFTTLGGKAEYKGKKRKLTIGALARRSYKVGREIGF